MIPDFLNKMLEEQYGIDLAKKIIDGYSKKRRVSLRVNTIKVDADHVKKELYNSGIEFEEIKWSKDALIINNVREKEIEELELYKNR